MFRNYYILTKPGIIRGNLLTALSGFGLASAHGFKFDVLVSLLVGVALVIAASCVFNNILDKDIDREMVRTKNRPLVSGVISTNQALWFGIGLAAIGFIILLFGTNLLTTLLGAFGLLSYVAAYTPTKHRSPYATLLGTLPGAVPPVAGYTAISGRIDLAAILLAIILIAWQMPHFYAISIRRQTEYQAAGIPTWPNVYGFESTHRQMILFGILFVASASALSVFSYTGYIYLVLMLLAGSYWVYQIAQGVRANDRVRWAKKIFLLSLPILPLFSLLLLFSQWLP